MCATSTPQPSKGAASCTRWGSPSSRPTCCAHERFMSVKHSGLMVLVVAEAREPGPLHANRAPAVRRGARACKQVRERGAAPRWRALAKSPSQTSGSGRRHGSFSRVQRSCRRGAVRCSAWEEAKNCRGPCWAAAHTSVGGRKLGLHPVRSRPQRRWFRCR